jgi:hypothetical protein
MAHFTRSLAALGPNTLVKALKADRTHHGLTYELGLNVCPQPFNDQECEPGGLYGCKLKDLFYWVSLYPDIDTVAIVEVPDDAQTTWFDTTFKASALVLNDFLPLHHAMELALQHGADIHAKNDEALRMASATGHLPVVQFLIEHGADVHANDDEALREASENGQLPVVQFLIQHGADFQAINNWALRWASTRGHLPVVQFLVEHGADVHAYTDEALRLASKNGHLPVVRFLVECGANVHAYDDEALCEASEKGHLPVVQFLIQNGVNKGV